MNIRNKLKLVKAKNIKPYTKNAKIHSEAQIEQIKESLDKYDYYSPIGIDKNNTIVFGHGRFEALKLKGVEDIEVVDLSYLKPKEIKKLRILDNKIVSDDYDNEILQAEINSLYGNLEDDIKQVSNDLSMDIEDVEQIITDTKPEDDTYTGNIEAPIYEIKGKKPTFDKMCNLTKTKAMIKEINGSKIPGDTKEFLINAAMRHTVFNYESIAEFYAHSTKEVQELMEKSALVIIDYKKAIENGFVRMTEGMAKVYGKSIDEK
jgi:hypothetical protein